MDFSIILAHMNRKYDKMHDLRNKIIYFGIFCLVSIYGSVKIRVGFELCAILAVMIRFFDNYDRSIADSWKLIKMECYKIQRILFVKRYYQNGENFDAPVRQMLPIFGRNNFSNSSAVISIIQKFGKY